MDPKQKRADAVARIKAIADKVKAAGRALTNDEQSETDGLFKTIEECDAQIKQMDADRELLAGLDQIADIHRAADEQAKAFPQAKAARDALIKSMVTKTPVAVSFPSVKAFSGATGGVVTDHATPGVTPPPAGSAAVSLRDKIVGYGTDNPIVRVYSASPFTGTAPVAEGGLKPGLDGKVAASDVTLQKLASSYPVTLEFQQDAPMLLAEVGRQALLDMVRAENGVILGAMDAAAAAGGSAVAKLSGKLGDWFALASEAIGNHLSLTGENPEWIFANPSDIAKVRNLRDAEGRAYLDPFAKDAVAPYGLELVQSAAIPAGTTWIGTRNAVNFHYHTSGLMTRAGTVGDQFLRNITTFLVEERVAASVPQPFALTQITLTA